MDRLVDKLILIVSGILAGGLIWLVTAPPRGAPIELRPAPTPAPLIVHVIGAVAAPGVYELPAGARVRDALEIAGGLLPEAGSDGLNQAAIVADGDQIVVPGVQAAEAPGPGTSAEPAASPPGGLVDINNATLAQLESLPGIGPAIAQRIIDYREDNGPFAKISDIVNVSGIGPATYEQIKDRITVGP
ncbi:MAG TPA: ComEA family DNA-binding protein [Anaerolineales bacterium]|nr:ComEA family DNA-binding protein [Anaerolineales bacterium]